MQIESKLSRGLNAIFSLNSGMDNIPAQREKLIEAKVHGRGQIQARQS